MPVSTGMTCIEQKAKDRRHPPSRACPGMVLGRGGGPVKCLDRAAVYLMPFFCMGDSTSISGKSTEVWIPAQDHTGAGLYLQFLTLKEF
ncbi:MAG: hypothetical protein DRH90_19855 [Deltaproteobacteria bacterium]|nr:MAG: hypothetical protein DRH90_19855 [Deltaproteobacteria bacterium]